MMETILEELKQKTFFASANIFCNEYILQINGYCKFLKCYHKKLLEVSFL